MRTLLIAAVLTFAAISELEAATITYSGSATVTESDFGSDAPVGSTIAYEFSWDDTTPNFSTGPGSVIFELPGGATTTVSEPFQAQASGTSFLVFNPTFDFGPVFFFAQSAEYSGPFAAIPSSLPALGTPGYGPLTLRGFRFLIDSSIPICVEEPTLPGCDIPLNLVAVADTLNVGPGSGVPAPGAVPEPATIWLALAGGAAIALAKARTKRLL